MQPFSSPLPSVWTSTHRTRAGEVPPKSTEPTPGAGGSRVPKSAKSASEAIVDETPALPQGAETPSTSASRARVIAT